MLHSSAVIFCVGWCSILHPWILEEGWDSRRSRSEACWECRCLDFWTETVHNCCEGQERTHIRVEMNPRRRRWSTMMMSPVERSVTNPWFMKSKLTNRSQISYTAPTYINSLSGHSGRGSESKNSARASTNQREGQKKCMQLCSMQPAFIVVWKNGKIVKSSSQSQKKNGF